MTGTPRRPQTVTVIVAEQFVSFQGEGPLTGQRCAFVRFSRCNLTCSWCDTSYTWDWSRYRPEEVSRRVPVPELLDWIDECSVDLVIVTGGEPMLQQPALEALVAGVDGRRVQVETNGTVAPTRLLAERVDLWVVSPKLANSGVAYGRRIVPAALRALQDTGRAVFKFVVTDTACDLHEIGALVGEHGLERVWVMPEGDTRAKVLAGMAAVHGPAVERGWNVSARLHILVGAR